MPGLHWPSLCPRIEEILSGQAGLLPLEDELEGLAQRYAAQLFLRQGHTVEPEQAQRSLNARRSFIEVDAESLEQLRPRLVGMEHAGLSVMRELGFIGYQTEASGQEAQGADLDQGTRPNKLRCSRDTSAKK